VFELVENSPLESQKLVSEVSQGWRTHSPLQLGFEEVDFVGIVAVEFVTAAVVDVVAIVAVEQVAAAVVVQVVVVAVYFVDEHEHDDGDYDHGDHGCGCDEGDGGEDDACLEDDDGVHEVGGGGVYDGACNSDVAVSLNVVQPCLDVGDDGGDGVEGVWGDVVGEPSSGT